jgi:hypothetical protein
MWEMNDHHHSLTYVLLGQKDVNHGIPDDLTCFHNRDGLGQFERMLLIIILIIITKTRA